MEKSAISCLLVEDEVIIAMAQQRELEKKGYKLIHASSGEKAVDFVLANKSPINLILMDIDLGPGMDGTEAASLILKKRDIPIVFLSSHTEQEVVEKTEKISSYGYVVKNSGIVVLDASIKMALKLHSANQKLKQKNEEMAAINKELIQSRDALIEQEDILAKSEARYRELFNNVNIGVAVYRVENNGEDFIVVGFNKAGLISDKDRWEEIIGKNIKEARPGAEAFGIIEVLKRVWLSGLPETMPASFYSDDRIQGWYGNYVYKLPSGEIVAVFENLTERKELENQLKLKEDQLEYFSFLGDLAENHCIEIDEKLLKALRKLHDTLLIPYKLAFRITLDDKSWAYPETFGKTVIFKENMLDGNKIFARLELLGQEETQVLFNNLAFTEDNKVFMKMVAKRISCMMGRNSDSCSLAEIKDRLDLALAIAGLGIWDYNVTNDTLIWNDRMYELHNVKRESFKGCLGAWINTIYPPDQRRIEDFVKSAMSKPGDYEQEYRVIGSDNELSHIGSLGRVYHDIHGKPQRIVGVSNDNTGKMLLAQSVERQLAEKESLLKEVHHRVKNNIITIESYLSIQADASQNEEIKTALLKAAARVISMRTVYDRLLWDNKYQTLDIKSYIEELVRDVVSLFPEAEGIQTNIQAEAIMMNAKTASTLGMIINELLTNAIKYAFKGRAGGQLNISLAKNGSDIHLVIRDNGYGLDEAYLKGNFSGFGLAIVKALAEQLNGSFKVKNDKGLLAELFFTPDYAKDIEPEFNVR